jgi:membrane-associated phospholipid phosphatase
MYGFEDNNLDTENNVESHVESHVENYTNDIMHDNEDTGMNLLDSFAYPEMETLQDMDERGIKGAYKNRKNVRDMSRVRLIENQEKNNKREVIEKIDKKDDETIKHIKDKNPKVVRLMLFVSFSVLVIPFFVVILLIITRNVKWLYIFISEFIIDIFVRLFEIALLKYHNEFLMIPGICIASDNEKYISYSKKFILQSVAMSEEENEEYSKRGFPSNRVVKYVSFIVLVYLFFPKYRKILQVVGPLYGILVMYSRIYLSCHTIFQVLMGAIVGVLGGIVMHKVFS